MKKAKLAPDVDAEKVAALTPGFTGADLANLVNEAALLATRRGADAVTMSDFNNAIERIVAGLEKKSRLLSPIERNVVAHHEMGHALVAAALPGTDPVHKISIIPRGVGALGYTIQRPTEDRYIMVKDELEKKMAVLLGGRAAERIIFNHLSTGAADDLSKVTQIARSMITRYAMIPALGQVTYDDEPAGMLGPGLAPLHRRDYSDETAREIDGALRRLVEEAFERALAILERNRPLLEEGARLLLEKETLAEADLGALFDRVVKDVGLPAPRPKSLPASA
jgi:cell division protease FtsH